MATDALTIPWSGRMGYAFSPFFLIGRCLKKLREEEASLVLVTPICDRICEKGSSTHIQFYELGGL